MGVGVNYTLHSDSYASIRPSLILIIHRAKICTIPVRKSDTRKSLTSDFCEQLGHSIPILDRKTAFISVIHIVIIFRIYKIVKLIVEL